MEKVLRLSKNCYVTGKPDLESQLAHKWRVQWSHTVDNKSNFSDSN